MKNKFTLNYFKLYDALNRVKLIIPNDHVVDSIKGINFKIDAKNQFCIVTATDGYEIISIRLSICEKPSTNFEFSVNLFKLPALKNRTKNVSLEIQVTVKENSANFEFWNENIKQTQNIEIPLLNCSYLSVQSCFPIEKPVFQIAVNENKMIDCLKSVKNSKKNKKPLILSFFGEAQPILMTIDEKMILLCPCRSMKESFEDSLKLADSIKNSMNEIKGE